MPLESLTMRWKVEALERHLYVGESRLDVENQFGHGVPRPDRLGGYAITSREAVTAPAHWDQHVGQYGYAESGAFCLQNFLGVAVFYDRHDRVRSWKRFGYGIGC